MKKYIVKQCVRLPIKDESGKIKVFKFSKDLAPGEYTEEDIVRLVSEDFLKDPQFAVLCQIGFIKVIEEKNVTEKTINKVKSFNKL